MDPFMVQTKIEEIKQKFSEKCGVCKKENVEEIVNCTIYNNIMDDCFRWYEKILSCGTYHERLKLEIFLLKNMKNNKDFNSFWQKSGYQFIVSEMGLIDYNSSEIKIKDILRVYESILI